VSATLLVYAPAEVSRLVIAPGDASAAPLDFTVTPRRTLSRKLTLGLAGDGSLTVENAAGGQALDLMLLLHGYSL
jgi:hypothetical protein